MKLGRLWLFPLTVKAPSSLLITTWPKSPNTKWEIPNGTKGVVQLAWREKKTPWWMLGRPLEALGKSQPCRHPEKWEITPLAWERCAPAEKVVRRIAPSLLDVWRINCAPHTEHLVHTHTHTKFLCQMLQWNQVSTFALKDAPKIKTVHLYIQ